ncbi:hypothetical protein DPMN_014661 [Dreissena polymorpha]|uniref:Uncharacterized protein n=1 Tax=Dreissena polymorpha TaxID=45954 RepID=A0A9D4NA28_DREPO|nr:hypothetical protein DPMN_014661 [Dreissena polymorpha]
MFGLRAKTNRIDSVILDFTIYAESNVKNHVTKSRLNQGKIPTVGEKIAQMKGDENKYPRCVMVQVSLVCNGTGVTG